MPEVPSLTVHELRLELLGSKPPILVDVREAVELMISSLADSRHVPISEFSDRMHELLPEDDLVIVCRSGHRSEMVVEHLLTLGYPRVRNLTGGINAWAREIDPTMSTY